MPYEIFQRLSSESGARGTSPLQDTWQLLNFRKLRAVVAQSNASRTDTQKIHRQESFDMHFAWQDSLRKSPPLDVAAARAALNALVQAGMPASPPNRESGRGRDAVQSPAKAREAALSDRIEQAICGAAELAKAFDELFTDKIAKTKRACALARQTLGWPARVER